MQLQSRSHINMNNNNTQTQVTLCGESQKWFLTWPSSGGGGRPAHHKQISPSGLHTHTQLIYAPAYTAENVPIYEKRNYKTRATEEAKNQW